MYLSFLCNRKTRITPRNKITEHYLFGECKKFIRDLRTICIDVKDSTTIVRGERNGLMDVELMTGHSFYRPFFRNDSGSRPGKSAGSSRLEAVSIIHSNIDCHK